MIRGFTVEENAFVYLIYYLSRDPMFLIINTIVLVGLATTAVGTVLQRRELLAWKSLLAHWDHSESPIAQN